MRESLDLRVKASGSGEQMGCWQSPAGPPLVVSPRDWKWLNTSQNTCDSNRNTLVVRATRLSNKSIKIISLFFYLAPYGFIGAAAQHQHFIWLLMRWIQWKDVLSGCGDLGRWQLFYTNIFNREEGDYEREKFRYLNPEPLGHNLNSPVRIKLVTDKLQVALSVCDPGDDQTVWWGERRNREPF